MMRIKKNSIPGEESKGKLKYSLVSFSQSLSSNGFTLIEVLIAMVIFSVGILGVAQMQIAGINGNASARMVTDTVVQATDKIELLMLLPYDHDDLTEGEHNGVAVPGYTIKWEVADGTLDKGNEGNKTITITVEHTGINSDKSFTFTQIKSEIN